LGRNSRAGQARGVDIERPLGERPARIAHHRDQIEIAADTVVAARIGAETAEPGERWRSASPRGGRVSGSVSKNLAAFLYIYPKIWNAGEG
jgi:hypothetical protein